MNGIFKSLPFRLLVGVAAGIVLGLWASSSACWASTTRARA